MSSLQLLLTYFAIISIAVGQDSNANRRDDGYGGGGGGSGVDVLAPLVLFAPLAGLAALYTAAAINSNSALVTLATLNTGRKKRDVEDEDRVLRLLQKRSVIDSGER